MFPENRRINYLDALKTLAIISVVICHTLLHSIGSLGPVVRIFHSYALQIFYFIAGLLCTSRHRIDSAATFGMVFWRRARQLMVPFAVFLAAYLLIEPYHKTSNDDPSAPYFLYGYWFLPSLLVCLGAVYALLLTTRKLDRRGFTIVMLLAAAACYPLAYLPIFDYGTLAGPTLSRTIYFFPFLAVGVVCREYYTEFLSVVSRWWVCIGLLAVYVVAAWLSARVWMYFDRPEGHLFAYWCIVVCGFIAVFGLTGLFHNLIHRFDEHNVAIRTVLAVGRNTLWIFCLHYFLLPNLRMLNLDFNHDPYFNLKAICVAVPVGITITLACQALIQLTRLIRKKISD